MKTNRLKNSDLRITRKETRAPHRQPLRRQAGLVALGLNLPQPPLEPLHQQQEEACLVNLPQHPVPLGHLLLPLEDCLGNRLQHLPLVQHQLQEEVCLAALLQLRLDPLLPPLVDCLVALPRLHLALRRPEAVCLEPRVQLPRLVHRPEGVCLDSQPQLHLVLLRLQRVDCLVNQLPHPLVNPPQLHLVRLRQPRVVFLGNLLQHPLVNQPLHRLVLPARVGSLDSLLQLLRLAPRLLVVCLGSQPQLHLEQLLNRSEAVFLAHSLNQCNKHRRKL
mmetsp:Transcript_13562/g.30799  ORF Transcript_13562/g.30799 Transcript_13562/m.30799 type:complete len:276 (+) Transcript_13562:184-1011(+)